MKSTRRGLLAFENLEVQPVVDTNVAPVVVDPVPAEVIVDPEAMVEADLIELSAVNDDISATEASIEEAEQVVETVEAINCEIEKSVEADEGLQPAVAEALRVAVEHMQNRLGYRGKNVFPAMENFGGKISKVEASKAAIASNKAMVMEARQSIAIAQEGIGESLANRWKLFWSNEEKLLKRLHEVSAAYDKGEVRKDTIDNPAWGKALNHSGKGFLTGKDIATDLKKLQSLQGSDKLAGLASKLADSIGNLSAAVHRSTFVSNKKDIEQIEKSGKEIESLNDKILAEFASGGKGKTDAHFTPLSAADKKTLVELAEDLLTNKKLASAATKFKDASSLFVGVYVNGGSTRLLGWMAEDVRKAYHSFEASKKSLDLIGSILKTNIYYCHGVVSYIAASVGKKSKK